jgi:hypothetical protein
MSLHYPFGYLKHKLWPKGQKSICQFDFQSLKVINCPDLFTHRWHATYRWKFLYEGYNFALDFISIEGLHSKSLQSHNSPNLENFVNATWESWDKMTFGCWFRVRHREYYKGEGGGFPQIWAVMSLVNLCLPVARPYAKNAPTMH